MESKYNTGIPIDINELPEEERQIAFHEWADGLPALENLLKEAYNKSFLSHGCCGGDSGKPYIDFQLNDEYSRKMAMVIAKRLVESNLDCRVTIDNDFQFSEKEYTEMREYLINTFPEDFSEENYSPTRTITGLNVQAKMENREKVFESMSEYIKKIEKDQLDNVKLPQNLEEIPSKDFNNSIKMDAVENSMKQDHPIQEETSEELDTRQFTTQEIGKATIEAPTTAKQEAECMEINENTQDKGMEGEEIGDGY